MEMNFFLPTAIQIPTIDVGNTANNIIPEFAKATINIRFNDQHTGESIKKCGFKKILILVFE